MSFAHSYAAIQGSGTGLAAKKTNPKKRGMQAFRAMLKHLKNGEMVLATADVPLAVFETGPSMVKLAAKSGAAIMPIGASFSPELPIVGTWDKSKLPLPFASRSLVFGNPLYIEDGDDKAMEAACQRVARRAQRRAGGSRENGREVALKRFSQSRCGFPNPSAIKKANSSAWLPFRRGSQCVDSGSTNLLRNDLRATQTFSDVLAGHLKVNATGMGALSLMHALKR